MLRIGEFSELSSISISMLRNYDKIGLLVPRSTEQASGYRYYDKAQLVQANEILALKSMGFGLEEIKGILAQPEAEVHAFLQQKLDTKQQELEAVQQQIRQIRALLDTKTQLGEYALEIARKKLHAMWFVGFAGQIDTYPEEGRLWNALMDACREARIPVAQNALATALYTQSETPDKLQAEVRFSLDKEYEAKPPLHVFFSEEQEVASVIFKGSYSQIYEVNTAVARWLETNGLEISGRAFTVYHNSPGNCRNEKEYITEICFPINEKAY
jgi:DNA-binding transcriptional MerR regulator/effector-binding domain-containing protein